MNGNVKWEIRIAVLTIKNKILGIMQWPNRSPFPLKTCNQTSCVSVHFGRKGNFFYSDI